MKEKKYIDRLYQEKFKDFEATPNEAVWRSISAKLQEKEQKRPVITPFWSRIAGIAAVLAIIFLIGDWIFPTQSGAAVANEDIEENFLNAQNSLAGNRLSINPDETPTKAPAFEPQVKKPSPGSAVKTSEVIPLKTPESRKAITSDKKNKIATTEVAKTRNKTPLVKKSLFEEIQAREEQIVEESSRGNFEVTTHAAPIYYGNFGKGNFLDPKFNENNSEGEVTYSYGVNIAYNISDKVKIRSGVNKVNMSFNTNGVSYQAVAGPLDISSVAFNDQTEVQMSDGSGRSSSSKQPVANSNRYLLDNVNSGLLNQKMGFIEVPLEVEYNLIDKKIELNIIGGASTLFLDENRVSVNSGNISAVGKASNLNEVSFSTNIGLGLDYNLSEKFKLNFEPMLKYQFNTFSSNPAGNQPYYMGIYSGFSYKF